MAANGATTLDFDQLRQLSTDPATLSTRLLDLMQALRSEDEEIRALASDCLEMLERVDAEQQSVLLHLCKDNASPVASWACKLLGQPELSPEAEEALVAVLKTQAPTAVQQSAAKALGQANSLSLAAMEALEQVTSSSDPRLQRIATQALERHRQQGD